MAGMAFMQRDHHSMLAQCKQRDGCTDALGGVFAMAREYFDPVPSSATKVWFHQRASSGAKWAPLITVSCGVSERTCAALRWR